MNVGLGSFDLVVERLSKHKQLAVDVESTGLRPFHGDHLFSLAIAAREGGGIQSYYFNFYGGYANLVPDLILGWGHLQKLKVLFEDPSKRWFAHNASFEMHMLGIEGIEIKGEIFCTMVNGRVAYNEHLKYDLASSLERIGLAKDDTVEKWIEEHKAFELVSIPGKKQQKKNKHFWKVPHGILSEYCRTDARTCLHLGETLEAAISDQSRDYPDGVPTLLCASRIEQRLAKTVHHLETCGVRIDRPYVQRALAFETRRAALAAEEFRFETGLEYRASPKLFADLFAPDKANWVYTEKNNPSFDSDVLKKFSHPAAAIILRIRDAKAKQDFYNGFLYHADADDVIHAHFKSTGTRTFRFSSSDPNLQNLSAEDATYCMTCKRWSEEMAHACPLCGSTDTENPEFLVRRAFIPRPGFVFVMFDYTSVEYSVMLDYAKHMAIQEFKSRGQAWSEDYFEVANKVRDGFDVHQATAELMGVFRREAKTLNFMLLYGGGAQKLADSLGVSLADAMALKDRYFRALPYVKSMINAIMNAVRTRGWVRSWAGYKFSYPNRDFAYTGPNAVIQGGCAAIIKNAMLEVDEYLRDKKSRIVLSIHDELDLEVHRDELDFVPARVKEIMEWAYPHRHIPLRVSVEWSGKSLADKIKGMPHVLEPKSQPATL